MKKRNLFLLKALHTRMRGLILVRENGIYIRVGSKESFAEFEQAQNWIRRGNNCIWGSACSFNAGPRSLSRGDALYYSWNVESAEASRGSIFRSATSDPFDFSKISHETGANKI